MGDTLETKLDALQARGVTLVDPRQIYLDESIEVNRVCAGAVLYPGTRLSGERTFIGPGAKIGSEGPAVLDNTAVGENAEVASGYLSGAVLLRDSRIGANAHVRGGTLLEEEASTAHAVGLKQTILMSFVTMGSLINFCDALVAGGTSRKDHTEVGSGFIHFNFTPWGDSGDKATPSLIGDVPQGVFLRQPRIFLGGLSALVGPQKVGFGAVTVAGQVLRREVDANRIVAELPREVDKPFQAAAGGSPKRKLRLNLGYIGQLVALRAWYRHVRMARIPAGPRYAHIRIVTETAAELLSGCIDERIERLRQFVQSRRQSMPPLAFDVPPCPLPIKASTPYVDHVEWVKSLSEADIEVGAQWLRSIAGAAVEAA